MMSMIFLICLSGCASTPHVGYKVDSKRQPSKNVQVTVKPFVDKRIPVEQRVIGGVSNGYGMRIVDVLEPAGLVKSLEEGFKMELTNSGYSVVDESHDIVIEGAIQSISCDITYGQYSTFLAHFKVTNKSQEILNKDYQGNKSILVTFDTSCSDAINAAMKDLNKNFIKDLDEYIKT